MDNAASVCVRVLIINSCATNSPPNELLVMGICALSTALRRERQKEGKKVSFNTMNLTNEVF